MNMILCHVSIQFRCAIFLVANIIYIVISDVLHGTIHMTMHGTMHMRDYAYDVPFTCCVIGRSGIRNQGFQMIVIN